MKIFEPLLVYESFWWTSLKINEMENHIFPSTFCHSFEYSIKPISPSENGLNLSFCDKEHPNDG